MDITGFPRKQGLYDPGLEKDACGVGLVCDIEGRRSNKNVLMGLRALKKLSHRGAVGADSGTGDGAGIVIQTPHKFFLSAAAGAGINLPAAGMYATGMVFLPRGKKQYSCCKETFRKITEEENQDFLGWRAVPVDGSAAGESARETMPAIEQPFIGRGAGIRTQDEFEIKLYIIRRRVENIIRLSGISQESCFYITTLSSRTFSYKGLLKPGQLGKFFIDLQDKTLESSICVFHARYSTNTFPSWNLAQPFRFLAHNGEINTIKGNIAWMKARENLLESGLFGADIKKILPVPEPGGSDSACMDNVFELLCLAGRTPEHSAMMLIPEAWENTKHMEPALKSFYEFHAAMMEPWDGPAAIAFTDGVKAGAVLDRNGLRPARYLVTRGNLLVLASEAGVLDIAPEDILSCGRLEPGKMLLADTREKRLIGDDEIKKTLSKAKPYRAWLEDNMLEIDKIPAPVRKNKPRGEEDALFLLQAFGYTREDLSRVLKPMAETASEPIGSMGNDTPLAVLSKKPELLYSYFKQHFAQVTNPAIDPIREKSVMSLTTYTGPEENMLLDTPLHAGKLKTSHPILTDESLNSIAGITSGRFRASVISILFGRNSIEAFSEALNNTLRKAAEAAAGGCGLIVLSDRGVDGQNAALPALLAAGAVHRHLVRESLRTKTGIIVETAEAREVHHFALLLGCGADLINPYLAFGALGRMTAGGELKLSRKEARENYTEAINKGLLKILSRMGISTLQSYRGAGIFEIVGLGEETAEKHFTGIPSRVGGMGIEDIARETVRRHESARAHLKPSPARLLPSGGLYSWKKDGAHHAWNPETITCLQEAVRNNDYKIYKNFADSINNSPDNPATLRSLLEFKKTSPVNLSEVEPASSIVKRFAAGAMSFGSISKEAHETIAAAMNRLKAMSNTGEGGEDPARFSPAPNKDSLRSSVKQVAAGRFGVTTHYLVNADELQIKISQGAKPGEGGHLPGHKVNRIIAKTRYTTPGVTLISPPPHHDIYSIEDLAQLIFDLKNVNPRARISVKLVSEAGVGTVAAGAVKGHADMILISGGDGGTGAAPLSSIRHAGLPWELGLSETHQCLMLNGLRSRVRLQVDGQMRTGKDAAIAAALGAEEFGFGSSLLVCMGCVMLRHCHLDSCVAGIAAQDESLRKRFRGRPGHIVNYMNFVAFELREIMACLGIRRVEELIGRTDLLKVNEKMLTEKTKNLDFQKILYKPAAAGTPYCSTKQDHKLEKVLDKKLIRLSRESVDAGKDLKLEMKIKNSDRAVGAMLSGRICAKKSENGLTGSLRIKFKGAAGQSFGAFLVRGITFELQGAANDYTGKGMFGGKIIIYPDEKSGSEPRNNVIIGNTAFYGATRGEAYIRGKAGERFCVRNSGITAVCEGLGDHGCEYMTGGTVVVLGGAGRNFAAGMSGGRAYIYDTENTFEDRCNKDMVETGPLEEEDERKLRRILNNHLKHTSSPLAGHILDDFLAGSKRFIKVTPLGCKKQLGPQAAGAKIETGALKS